MKYYKNKNNKYKKEIRITSNSTSIRTIRKTKGIITVNNTRRRTIRKTTSKNNNNT
jgi:hypothetical protein